MEDILYPIFYILKCISIPTELFSFFLYSGYHPLERKMERKKVGREMGEP